MERLNPLLYQQLRLKLGNVRVSNDRSAVSVDYAPDYVHRQGRLSAQVTYWGETYSANCPFCGDTRQRLAISHRWAVRDQKTGDDMLHLAICFNEGCLATRENQKKLNALLYPNGRWAMEVDLPKFAPKPVIQPQPAQEIVLPLGIPLDVLSANHPAVEYVRERGFDPAYLAHGRGVTYCSISPSARPPIEQRLVIPIRQPGKREETRGKSVLVGWQARTIIDQTPKYLTSAGTRRNQLLYGLHQAVKTSGPVVVAEGPMDVWRIGSNAVALIGKTISPAQCSLIVKHFPRRPVIVWLDAGTADEAEKVRVQVLHGRVGANDDSPVFVASTPVGKKDPGECTETEIKQTIEDILHVTAR